jgi:predicted RNase H-like HicB family nuclease
MAKHFYPAVLERGAKGTFAVWFPNFPDCVAAGMSQEAAIAKAELVLAQTVDSLAEHDATLPKPIPFEKILIPKGSRFVAFFLVGVEPPDPSERVNIYLPKSLIARADKRAAELGMSRSSFFGFAVSGAIGMSVGISVPQLGQPRSKAQRSGKLRAASRAKRRTPTT